MKLFHTSPKEIKKIDQFGNFEDCLFFSARVYQMAIGEVITYSIDAENMDFIEAWKLSDDEIAAEIAKKLHLVLLKIKILNLPKNCLIHLKTYGKLVLTLVLIVKILQRLIGLSKLNVVSALRKWDSMAV